MNKNIIKRGILDSFKKLDVRYMIKNPVMFVVEIGFFLSVILTIAPTAFGDPDASMQTINAIVAFILLLTLLFANFAESLAEGRGKAQANTLRQTKKDMMANRIMSDGSIEQVAAAMLQRGDRVRVVAGETIPNDGEVIEGVATVDESAPVVKEPGGDFCSVTGGTTVTSDALIIEITSEPGASFLDKMIAMVEGASRKKTPNEIALSTLLVSLTLIFVIVIVSLKPLAMYVGITIPTSILIALSVCLIPTTIGGLLSAIGIAGMDRVTRFNVIAMSGKAVEASGDVDVMILDKTGTITYGNRMAHEFLPVAGVSAKTLAEYAMIASMDDNTPEGKSIVALASAQGIHNDSTLREGATFQEFTAQTRMSGYERDDLTVMKGAADAIKTYALNRGQTIPQDLDEHVNAISKLGGTPLVVIKNNEILGVVYLKDTIKEGLVERFARLRAMGIKTIMCTGDNPLTAATIAQEAGVDGFLAECKPEDKIDVIKQEQAQGKVVAMTGDGTNDAPALAQADVGIAMNSGTIAAKEAANMVDLDSDPTKILDIVEIGKQLLMTRGALTTFSIANDIAKYFAVLPALFVASVPALEVLNIMHLNSATSAILSALIFNALIIPALVPIAMKGVKYRPTSSDALLTRNLIVFGLGGIITPFVAIKLIDVIIAPILLIMGI